MHIHTLTIVAVVFLLAGAVKGMIGLGLPTIAMGLLTLAMPPSAAASLLLVPSFITNVWQLWLGPSFGALLRRLWPLLAGLTVGTPFYNWMTAIAMWFGRFGTIVPVLAIAGSLAAKKRIAVTSGTLPTHGPLFVVLLLGTVLLVGALTYVPALALGPGVEHLMMWLGA